MSTNSGPQTVTVLSAKGNVFHIPYIHSLSIPSFVNRKWFFSIAILSGVAGIYLIHNNTTGAYYIGQSMDLASRLTDHFCFTSRTRESLINSAILKHGSNQFSVYILSTFTNIESSALVKIEIS